MIAELGHFSLILALLAAAVSAGALLFKPADDTALWHQLRRNAMAQFGLVALAFAALLACHVGDDFSVLNVVQHSHTLKPLLYKIAGVWGNHEGSLLLWLLVLAGYGGLFACQPTSPNHGWRTLSLLSCINLLFILFALFTSNPFWRVSPMPANGADLNPLLQDPALALHPPFLYLGYVGFAVLYAGALAGLLIRDVSPAWAKQLRPFAIAAWCCLTIGIALGSFWAYYELGWGGYWFWDPVENAALLPWLAGTALLHCLLAVERRATLTRWAALLAIITFSLSLLGFFLVRSGVLTSVHSFAQDPARGVFILAILAIAAGGGLAVYAWRAPQLRQGQPFQLLSREGALVFNNLVLLCATATVLLGTLYPLWLDMIGGPAIAVGPPYFNATFAPLMLPLLVAMVLAPQLSWQKHDRPLITRQLVVLAAGCLCALLAALYSAGSKNILGLAAASAGIWVIAISLATGWQRRRSKNLRGWGQWLAHGAMGIMVLGIAGSAFSYEEIIGLAPGQTTTQAGIRLELQNVTTAPEKNYETTRATAHLWRANQFIATLQPERRWYPVAAMRTTEAAIAPIFFTNYYLTLGDAFIPPGTTTTAYSLRLAVHPLVNLIWLGALLMALGGGLTLWPRRAKTNI